MQKKIIIFSLLILSTSCSYFARKDCEKTNWFEYGKSAALNGKRLSGDKRIEQCMSVEANVNHQQLDSGFKSGYEQYCQPSYAETKGKSGNSFNFEFCQPSTSMLNKMKTAYQNGLNWYCSPENAYEIAKAGKDMPAKCSQEQQKVMMANFNKGRKIYLKSQIQAMYDEIDMKEIEINQKHAEIRNIDGKLNNVRSQKNAYMMAGVLANTDKTQSALDELKNQEGRLLSERNREQSNLTNIQNRIIQVKRKIRAYESEISEL